MYHKLLEHITFAILENLLSPRKVMYYKLLGHITFAILPSCNKFGRLAIMLMARGNVAWNSCNALSTGEELLVGVLL